MGKRLTADPFQPIVHRRLGDDMKITGSSTVEYIEVDGHDYERTGCGTWTVRMGESMEPVYDPADLEREYQETTGILHNVPNCQGLLDSSAFQHLLEACKEAEAMLGRIGVMEVNGEIGRLVCKLRAAIIKAENDVR